MKNIQDKAKWMREFLPVLLIAALVTAALHGYVAPVFEIAEASTELMGLLQQTADQTTDQAKIQTRDQKKTSRKEKDTNREAEAAIESVTEASAYRDGTFSGEAQGFGGLVKVEVTVSEGKIAAIEVTEAAGEGADFLARAKGLIAVIVSDQSTNVDAVSGATYTSKGIINAVRNALAKAAVNEGENQELTTDTANDTNTTVTPGTFPYKDGVYTGSGVGFSGNITVAIVIENQSLQAAVITESVDDETFLNRAKTILNQMVTNQSTEVDVVSGATYSSNGIIEAVRNAIKAAKEATNGTEPDEDGRTDSREDTNTGDDDQSDGKEPADSEDAGTTNGRIYADGTYSVSTVCEPDERKAFEAYDLSMKVTIKKDVITAIKEVAGSGEDYNPMNDTFIDRVVNGMGSISGMVAKILAKGNIDQVDVVSGATCTSKAIMAGCKEALKQAKEAAKSEVDDTNQNENGDENDTDQNENGNEDDTDQNESNDEDDTEEGSENGSENSYKDGTYVVTAICAPDQYYDFTEYTISLTVVIKNQALTSITDVKGVGASYDSFNDYYIGRASNGSSKYKGVIAQILEKGMPENIDAVSGATCSSNAIVEGVKAALKVAAQP